MVMFLGDARVAHWVGVPLTYVQFVPSATKFLLNAGGIASVGFLLVILLTLGFGRIYCSVMCPLGIFQDVLGGFRKRMSGKKSRFTTMTPFPLIRNAILAATLISAVSGSLFFVNLLDPYSLFGRILYFYVRPMVYLVNNLGSSLLEALDIYALPPIPLGPETAVSGLAWMPSLFLLFLLGFLALFYGRQYCGLICPVGTLLGHISKMSLVRIRVDRDACNQCGKCQRVCKAGCINPGETHIDLSRCVVCFNCLEACSRGAVQFGLKPVPVITPSRRCEKRRFLLGGLVSCFSVYSIGLPVRSLAIFDMPRNYGGGTVITPPGSKGIQAFSDKCTACHLCLNACEENVLQPALFAYGASGLSQPAMDFNKGKCAYECHACGQVCPTGAIDFLPIKIKQRTQIGRVALLRDTCIVYQRKIDCGACAEVCPTHAVYTEIRDNAAYPKVRVDTCIGCGACQKVCPTRPKSIVVKSNQIHSIAREPVYLDPARPEGRTSGTGKGEFPF